MEKECIKIIGINNEQDANKILHALKDVWGIREAEVSVVNQAATISYNERAASLTDFIQAVKNTGFDIND
ncbi:heavy-metal-associated domain-containing protein [Heyndrickxia acidicola]|uniref:Heavy metal-associated domain-containing protein n=1 Tax=Heyndrickxia acidicola TaxID=209389 RepID=A0ABU6MG73_9BACI|nr:heavy metal-associated domain-containing protein [Heyndrickxia acidicola]MED1203480.1 heavy metal-associated domain-containing protein [Heyndrickxia acidicola]